MLLLDQSSTELLRFSLYDPFVLMFRLVYILEDENEDQGSPPEEFET